MPSDWQSVTTLPQLAPDEIQIWRIHLSGAIGDISRYSQHLSSEELERSNRLRSGQVRMQFVVARACLRVLLGNLLGLPSNLVPIDVGAYGKPETPPVDGLPLFFNVAHSRETILIALCRFGRVGIDLEYFDRTTEVLEIARHSFTPNEVLQIEQTADPAERQRAFFRCWTRKEAVVKADGRGLSLPLSLVEVPVHNSEASTPVVITEEAAALTLTRTWWVSDIAIGEEAAATFAVEIPKSRTRTFTFPLEVASSK